MNHITSLAVYVESGKNRAFAGAVDWPGWCRGGHNESEALDSLFDCALRYAAVVAASGYLFSPPVDRTALNIVERLKGDSTTDFGAPGIPPASDSKEVDEAELRRLQALLKAAWNAFDGASVSAKGLVLRKGPRGGGRDLDGIARHVTEAQVAYLGRIGVKLSSGEADNTDYLRQVIIDSFEAAAHHRLPEKGPRGGALWKPRYFIRRTIWHIVDHAWEIEDRIM